MFRLLPGRTDKRRVVTLAAISVLLIGTASLFPLLVPGPQRQDETVYRIGTDNAYPYHFLNDAGKPDGMVAEVIDEAARRAGILLRWELRSEGPFRALSARKVDLWPLLSVQPGMWPQFHFSRPYLRNSYLALTTNAAFGKRSTITSVRRAASVQYPLAMRYTGMAFPKAELKTYPTREQAMSAMCRGEADAVVAESRAAQHLLLKRPPGCAGLEFHPVGLDLPVSELGIAALKGDGAVADRLREEIDRMMDDGTMARQLQYWNYYYSGEAETLFREMEAQSAKRLSLWLAAVTSVLAVLLLLLLLRVRGAKQTAVAANAAKSQFLASMSHEIRTPLHGIIGMGQILSETRLEGGQRECVDLILGSGRTLLDLVDDLLDLARIERGELRLQPAVFDPGLLVAETVRAFAPLATQKGIELRAGSFEELPSEAFADGARIRQVLTNLLGNAVKFTSRGTIEINVSCVLKSEGCQMRVTVQDSGIGIAQSAQKELFQKFFQADASIGRRFGGTGLGLAISKELVEAMRGEIGVESTPGLGSTFWFTVPLAPVPAATPAKAVRAEAVVILVSPQAAHILLVEDNAVNQLIAQRLLEKAGHQVTTVADGESALCAVKNSRFDAIFMDCQMPGMDGYQATAEIRKQETGSSHTPIIALTAAAMEGERARCLTAGMDDYLTKPIDLVELNRVLQTWVHTAAARRTP